ncbi:MULTISPECIES: sensor histidine kinase [unclassified Saccharicrinis]|uniref:sensor histidine kinase n=1 Tax=unclassified Saccharicrinis TaxID=2646859 RepID=UPI003D32C598
MQIIKSKLGNWLPHIIAIAFVLLMPLFVFDRSDNHLTFWRYMYYYQMFFMTLAFYVNYLVLVPRLYFSKNKIVFFIAIVLFILTILSLWQMGFELVGFDEIRESMSMEKPVRKDKREGMFLDPRAVDNIYLLILVISTSTGLAIIHKIRQNEKVQQEKERAHQDTELAFLKNQISPHFFFNALNNIYALIAIDSDKAQKSVEKLSALMRYLIYESDIKTIALQKEFDFTRNYIDLMRQRLTSKVKLDVSISNQNSNTDIPPLMFIPFIENAFKHGVSYREQSFIKIELKQENNQVKFACKNSIPQKGNSVNDEKGGVGITNIKKRLDLIYGDRAILNMDIEENVFSVSLIIPLEY